MSYKLILICLIYEKPETEMTTLGSTGVFFLFNLSKRCSITEFSSVQSLSRVHLFVTPMDHTTPGLLVYHQLPEFT